MTTMFGVDLPELLAGEMGPEVSAVTLVVITYGSRATPSSGKTPTRTSHNARGHEAAFDLRQVDATTVERNDRRVIILAGTMSAVPAPGDEVAWLGTTYRIFAITSDPARAIYDCHLRGA